MVNNWVESCVMVGSFMFEISSAVLAESVGLPDEGLKIQRDKHPQQTELDLFTSSEKIGWDGKYILRKV